ncbi:MAG: 5'/3'-nucleotidase SurE [Planctomycetota bacterium]
MILLINDDGIKAPGLRLLYQALRQHTRHPVLAVAPAAQHSGQAHAITLERGLNVDPVLESDFFGFSVDGTPVDCLKVALKVLCHTRPRLVVSGINAGPNVGRSLFYSGTVAAALEAAVEGQAALAVSQDVGETDLAAAADYAARFAHRCIGRRELVGSVLNLNLPAVGAETWGELRLVPHGMSGFDETYVPVRVGQRIALQLHGERVELEHEGETDAHALAAHHPTLSLLEPDFNAADMRLPGRLLDRLRRIEPTATAAH